MHLLRAQQQMKLQADSNRRPEEFIVGDMVCLKIRPYRQRTLAKRRNEKLSPQYYGPYKILRKIGKVAYELQLPAEAKIHSVVHVSQLRRSFGDRYSTSPLPPSLTADLVLHTRPETVLQQRFPVSGSIPDSEVLIKWQDLPDFEATWEPFAEIVARFPTFHLEDKVKDIGRGNDRPMIHFTYHRKNKKVKSN